MHTFTDASTKSYGVCSYLRVLYVDGLVKCYFVMGKSNVVNRIELIHTLTSANQWRYVPIDLNSAGIASRGVLSDMVDHAGTWFSGPQFLYDCASSWPNQPDFLRELHNDDPEIKPARASMAQIPLETKDCLNQLFERYSDLRSLLLSVCWMLRVIVIYGCPLTNYTCGLKSKNALCLKKTRRTTNLNQSKKSINVKQNK